MSEGEGNRLDCSKQALDRLGADAIVERLVITLEAGDEFCVQACLERLCDAFADQVRFWCRKGGDPDVVRELTQETFMRMIKSLRRGRYPDARAFGGWLRQIAFNTVADYYRGSEGDPGIGEFVEEHEGEEGSWGETGVTEFGRKGGAGIADASGVEDELIEREADERLRKVALEALPEKSRNRRVVELAGDPRLGFGGLAAKPAAELVNQEFRNERDPMTDVNIHQILSRYRKRLDELCNADNPEAADA